MHKAHNGNFYDCIKALISVRPELRDELEQLYTQLTGKKLVLFDS